jgi:hypothetical protein
MDKIRYKSKIGSVYDVFQVLMHDIPSDSSYLSLRGHRAYLHGVHYDKVEQFPAVTHEHLIYLTSSAACK